MTEQSLIQGNEKRKRIQVSVWAYAYEIKNNPIVPDDVFDRVCGEIDLSINTGNKKMDNWFIKNFEPHTGQWIHKHPTKGRLQQIYQNITE